ncbi:lysophospholipid acyltransferase family protein [Streptomyces sp. ME19-01-6]|uniref:lysophospholipid acyltransferase family protein n=1 Tax=Streptomyces sp. ME19-01-6 TaxID=3028686 RepID=UPI0029A5E621|nr:lysophospholipid acyltransferase family protein [Streptomyces sp. ME19-01-6]MDX3233147.1 lysophospholipid acyltransferase family protein [Streptomyces sp. ME19-01-6]
MAHTAARVPAARAAGRTASFARVAAGALLRGGRLAEPDTLRAHAAAVLGALDIRLEVHGGPLSVRGHPGTLVVANHISWLDIIALLAVEPVTMLAKREVGQWPVVGSLVRRAGTLFIDRGTLRGLPDTVATVSGRLRSGHSVMVFPQGVTWCAGTGGRFRRATFQAALDAGAPVRPVTLDYFQHGAPTTVAAFVGEDDFGSSVRRVLGAAGLTVRVRIHQPLSALPGVDDRRTLAARAQAAVCGAELSAHG